MIRVVIADDEPIALERLELAMAGVSDAQVVGKARNGKQALQFVRELKPDLLVLDIQMPGLDGLGVVEALDPGDTAPEVVFVTAYQDHAIRAFELHAVDYMLKPVEFSRFREALGLIVARIKDRAAGTKLAELQELVASLRAEMTGRTPRFEEDFWVRNRKGLQRIPVQDVELISADGDYVQLHTKGQSFLHKDTIASLELRLKPELFLRVHRSAIVRLDEVTGLKRQGPRKTFVTLRAGQVVAVGPSYIEKVIESLHARRWR